MYNTTASQHLPPINVTFEHPFISGMVKMTPSPDWFVGFSDLRMVSPVTETYYNRIVLQSYIWDSGTDGKSKSSSDMLHALWFCQTNIYMLEKRV